MAWTKTKTAIISAVVVASLVTPLVLQQKLKPSWAVRTKPGGSKPANWPN